MAIAEDFSRPMPGLLRGWDFDLAFILGLAGGALAFGAVLAARPEVFGVVLLADLWLLGYPHVVSTFTRLAGDPAGRRANRFLMIGLPLIVLSTVAAAALGVGGWLVGTAYFYWQWYHTVRQSWGVAQLYRRKSAGAVSEHPALAEALFYLVPAWGLLHRLAAAPDRFLSLPVRLTAVPPELAQAVGVLACAGLLWWAIRCFAMLRAGTLPVAHTLYVASHHLIFIMGYLWLADLDRGWLVTNLWHTAQYMMVVWLFNAKEAQGSGAEWWRTVRAGAPRHFFAFCLAAALPVYLAINLAGMSGGSSGVMMALILSQSINFHHFIVDAIIWRGRRKPA